MIRRILMYLEYKIRGIRHDLTRGYLINKTEGSYSVCKILNEYDNEEEATDDLLSLLSHKITEKDLLKKSSKKRCW